jgi:hypothetical protein
MFDRLWIEKISDIKKLRYTRKLCLMIAKFSASKKNCITPRNVNNHCFWKVTVVDFRM